MELTTPIASTDYIHHGFGLYLRLGKDGNDDERLRTGQLKLTDRHVNRLQEPAEVLGTVQSIELKRNLFVATIDVPDIDSNARYIEQVEAGLRGKSFSIGASINEIVHDKSEEDGAVYYTATKYAFYEVADTPTPADPRAVRRSLGDDQHMVDFHFDGLDNIVRDLKANAPQPKEERAVVSPTETQEQQVTRAEYDDLQRRLKASEDAREADAKAEADRRNRDTLRNIAIMRGLDPSEGDKAAAANESVSDFVERVKSIQVQADPLPTVKRSGFKGVNVGRWVVAGLLRHHPGGLPFARTPRPSTRGRAGDGADGGDGRVRPHGAGGNPRSVRPPIPGGSPRAHPQHRPY